jgi:hypothetical protein
MVMTDLENTLTSALRAEADRATLTLNTVDAAHRLESRLDRIDRDRHRRTWRTVLSAAAAAVLVAAGVYGVTRIHSRNTEGPTHHSTVQDYRDDGRPIRPGTYRVLVGVDDAAVPIDADLTFYGVWEDGNYPVYRSGRSFGGVAVYQPLTLAAGTGCLKTQPNRQIAETPQKLAQELAHLPRSTVLQPPTAVQAFDRTAVHVRLRIDQDCPGSVYRVAMTARGGHGISFGDMYKPVFIDFWVEAVGGTPLVVETWYQAGAPSQMLNQIDRTRSSIHFVTHQ